MKTLYVVNACDNKYVDFYAVHVEEDKEDEFIVSDKINIEGYIHNFPKDKINVEFDFGYVIDTLDKVLLRKQIDRIYENLKKKHLDEGEVQYAKTNEDYYKSDIDLLKRCITPEEDPDQKIAKKEREELEKRFGFLW